MRTGRRDFLKIAGVAGTGLVAGRAASGKGGGMPDSAARGGPAKENFSTELFLDNTFIEETPGVFRRLHPPRKHRLNPVVRCDRWWENTYAQPYCTMYDAEAKLFKMWMRSGSDQKTGYVDGYAGYTTYLTSTDGIHWDKPALGVLEIAGRRDHNIVFTGFEPDTKTQPRQKGVVIPNAQRYQGKKGWLWSVLKHPNPRDESEKYVGLAFLMKRVGAHLCTSPDGIHWKRDEDSPFWQTPHDVSGSGDDALLHMIYDRAKQKWVIYRRIVPEFSERMIAVESDRKWQGVDRYNRSYAYAESDDLKVWKNYKFILAMDADDPPDTEIYQFAAHKFGDIYVGYMSVFHLERPQRIDIQLATSRDGVNFARVCRGTPFIPNGPLGYFDYMAMCCSQPEPVVLNDTVYVYYAGLNFPHEAIDPPFEQGGVGLATFKRDRFASLETGDFHSGPGDEHRTSPARCRMVTKAFTVRHSRLFLNAATWEKGSIRVEALTRDWQPIPGFTEPQALGVQGDALDHPVRWKDNIDVSKLVGKEIRIKFYMTRARMYAMSLTDEERKLNAVESEYRDDKLGDSTPKLI